MRDGVADCLEGAVRAGSVHPLYTSGTEPGQASLPGPAELEAIIKARIEERVANAKGTEAEALRQELLEGAKTFIKAVSK